MEIEKGSIESAKRIIKKDVRIVNMIPSKGGPYHPHYNLDASPLCRACRGREVEIVKFLLEHGADPNMDGSSYEDSIFIPLQAALYNEMASRYDLRTIEEVRANPEEQKVTEIVRLLFAYGAVVPELDRQEPPYHTRHEETPAVERTRGKKYRIQDSCIYWACRQGHIDSLRMLLEHGAHPNYGMYGLTAYLDHSAEFFIPETNPEKTYDEWGLYNPMRELLCSFPRASPLMCVYTAWMENSIARDGEEAFEQGKRSRKHTHTAYLEETAAKAAAAASKAAWLQSDEYKAEMAASAEQWAEHQRLMRDDPEYRRQVIEMGGNDDTLSPEFLEQWRKKQGSAEGGSRRRRTRRKGKKNRKTRRHK